MGDNAPPGNFNDFYTLNGIERQLSELYTPQQNGVGKLVWYHTVSITWSRPTRESLAEAIRAACNILSLCSTKLSRSKSPNEHFAGSKLDVSRLWIFGSTLLFETIPGKNKLDSRSRKCLYYLNANGKTKGYCCFHPTTRSVIVSKDIRSWGHTTIKDLSWSISHARTIKALPKRCQDSWHVYSHQRSNALHGTIYICHHRRPDESWCCESVCWLCL